MEKWDQRMMDQARLVASWSKDPSTQVGAVIVRPDRTIASHGFNGFPRGVRDLPERYENRDTKLKFIVHAEVNALLNAHCSVQGCTMYTWPLPPCPTCTGFLIQAGIKRVVAPVISDELKERWGDGLETTIIMLQEAGIEYGDGGYYE